MPGALVRCWMLVSSQPRGLPTHSGRASKNAAMKAGLFSAAYAANPAGLRHRKPEPPKPPTIAWINEPVSGEEVAQKAS